VKLTRKRLLFVDDEPGIRATLPVILRRYGFTVAVAATVPQAVEEIHKNEFDLLLCDLNIERAGDGYDVIRVMREVNPQCVAIVLTGYPNLESAVEGIHVGIDHYISKPANADTLVAVLAEKLAAPPPKARILSVSYDKAVQQAWRMLLESQGYEVVVPVGLAEGLERCKDGLFDIFVLGRSVPEADKPKLVKAFRRVSAAPIISVPASSDERVADGADFHVQPDPEQLLRLIADLVRRKSVGTATSG
jgi:DNA-binding NtrC family response regulator